MKLILKITTISIMTFLLSTTVAIAGGKIKNVRMKGYAINIENDTIFGKIKARTFDLNYYLESSKDKFKMYDTSKTKRDIVPSRYKKVVIEKQGEIFEYYPIQTDDDLLFLLSKNQGKVQAYKYLVFPCKLKIIVNMTVFCFGKPSVDYFLRKDRESEYLVINKKDYKQKLVTYLSNNEELCQKIGSRNYKYKDIEDIIYKYLKFRTPTISAL